MDRMAFWKAWFGPSLWGREVGDPCRQFIDSPTDFVEFCLKAEIEKAPAYMSVNPFKNRDAVYGLEKLFFDFDDEANPENAVREALEFAGALRQYYRVRPLVVPSGSKGAHVYVWIKTIITGNSHLLKRFLEKAVEVLLYGFEFKTLDRPASIDVKRLARVPYTVHNKTGRLCQPIGEGGEPLKLEAEGLKVYRENGFGEGFIREIARRLRRGEEESGSHGLTRIMFNVRRIRPQVQALIDKARSGVHLTYRCHLIILFELLNKGWSDEEIHSLFMEFFGEAYNRRETQYYITHARRRGYLPFKTCNIVQEMRQAGLEVAD
jgi:hypothetical protein